MIVSDPRGEVPPERLHALGCGVPGNAPARGECCLKTRAAGLAVIEWIAFAEGDGGVVMQSSVHYRFFDHCSAELKLS